LSWHKKARLAKNDVQELCSILTDPNVLRLQGRNVSLVSINAMNSFAPVPSEDDAMALQIMDKKCESAILEEDASSEDDYGDFEDYSHDSYDNDISYDNNSKELYGKAQNVMSGKATSSTSDSDNNYSHISYVLECMEDEMGEKTNEDYDNEANVSNIYNHNMGLDYQNELQFAKCFPE